MSLTGLFSMLRFVFILFFFYGIVIITRSRTRTIGTRTKRVKQVVSMVAPIFPFRSSAPRSGLSPTLDIDGPEYGPGAIFGPSGVYTSGVSTSSASASSTPSYKPSHSGGHAGAIAGGVIGGIAIISIAGAAIFYLQRRRSRVASAGVDYHAYQPMLSDGAVAHSSSGSPQTMRFYVRVLISRPAANL